MSTVITNVMTGRPARGVANRVMREVGPVAAEAPPFPHAATALAPLKGAAEKQEKVDFTNLWAGQAAAAGPGHVGRGPDSGRWRRPALHRLGQMPAEAGPAGRTTAHRLQRKSRIC